MKLIQNKPGLDTGLPDTWRSSLYDSTPSGQTRDAMAIWGVLSSPALLIRQANHTLKPFQAKIPLDKTSHTPRAISQCGQKVFSAHSGRLSSHNYRRVKNWENNPIYYPSLGLSFPFVKIRELNQFLQGQSQLFYFIILMWVLIYSSNKHFLNLLCIR